MTQSAKIEVEIKNVYGTEKIYPVSDSAKVFAEMLGQATLTSENIKHIKKLGYAVQVISSKPREL